MNRSMRVRPYPFSMRAVAAGLAVTFTIVFTVQDRAFASHVGSSSSSAGSATPPAMQVIETFQPDLSTGRATLGIPIAVPPGRRGVQPGVSIGYSSSARNGLLGVGWSLELGCIERSTRLGIPSFNSSDTFTLRYGGAVADLVEISAGEYRLKDEQLGKVQCEVYRAERKPIFETTWFDRKHGRVLKRTLAQGDPPRAQVIQVRLN